MGPFSFREFYTLHYERKHIIRNSDTYMFGSVEFGSVGPRPMVSLFVLLFNSITERRVNIYD